MYTSTTTKELSHLVRLVTRTTQHKAIQQ